MTIWKDNKLVATLDSRMKIRSTVDDNFRNWYSKLKVKKIGPNHTVEKVPPCPAVFGLVTIELENNGYEVRQ